MVCRRPVPDHANSWVPSSRRLVLSLRSLLSLPVGGERWLSCVIPAPPACPAAACGPHSAPWKRPGRPQALTPHPEARSFDPAAHPATAPPHSLTALSFAPVSHGGSPAARSRGLLPVTPRQACPVAPACLRPACCRQGARPAARRGVGEASGGLPNSEGTFPTGLWHNSVWNSYTHEQVMSFATMPKACL